MQYYAKNDLSLTAGIFACVTCIQNQNSSSKHISDICTIDLQDNNALS